MHEQGQISIHTENIFPIIKKSLYSDREIFLRELIANAVDAIAKLKMVNYAGEFTGSLPDPAIQITLNKDDRTITIDDNGVGMTADEVKRYINQVAFSSASEFLEKYKGTDQGIIGHFGLGFYSSFMVASHVELVTKSYRADSEAVHWACDGSTSFTLDSADREAVGTAVTLTLAEGEDEYLEPGRIKELVKKFCDFIPVPIKLGDEVINRQKPLWTTSPSELSDEDYLEFYRYLYPFQDDPLFWIHINTDYPFLVQGILYFPKFTPDIDPNRGQIKLFCSQVFVSDNCEEVIPKFLLPLRGALDSPDIPLNVSRSSLQGDRTVRRIAEHIAKKVGDKLLELFNDERERYAKAWPDISLFMKFGVMNSDKFYQQVKDTLLYKTSAGDFVTLKEYLERNEAKQGKTVYYATDAAAQRSYIELHTSQGLEVLVLNEWIDTHFTSFIERENSELNFKRVDSELDQALLEEDASANIVDPKTNKTRAETLVELFQVAIAKEKLTIKVESLKSDSVPAMILLPETLRRLQEMSTLMQQPGLDLLANEHTLVINSNHPMVRNLQELASRQVIGSDDTLVPLLCQHIYDLALLAQKNPEPAVIQSFLERANTVLTRLTAKVAA